MSLATDDVSLNRPSRPAQRGRLVARRTSLWLLMALPTLLLAGASGCGHMGAPAAIRLSEADLQRLLTDKFPQQQKLLEVFAVRASAPQLRLLPDSGRLQVRLALDARERIMASRYSGSLEFDTALRWDAAEQAVRLDRVRVHDVVLDPARSTPPAPSATSASSTFGDSRRSGAQRLAAALAERVLEGLVLYRLPADKLAQLDRAGVLPAALNVTRSGLEITFAPKPKQPANSSGRRLPSSL